MVIIHPRFHALIFFIFHFLILFSKLLRIMAATMVRAQHARNLLLLFTLFIASSLLVIPSGAVVGLHSDSSENPNLFARKLQLQGVDGAYEDQNIERKLIGSTAPTCTFNECRGCKYRCRAEQIPVDGNDPLNSAYRYKCVCHR